VTSVPSSVEYRLDGPSHFAVHTRELQPLPADWARLRFVYCGICGSDMSTFEHRREIEYPISLGHEFIAEVAEVGASVDSLKPGNFVTSDLNYRCGDCEQCRAQRSHLCHVGQTGMFSNRAFADFGDIHASYLLRLDTEPGRHLALSEPLSCVLHAKQWANVQPADRVLVIGAGGIGLCMAFALCQQDPPVAFEITDLSASRLKLIGKAVAPRGRATPAPQGKYDVVFDVSGSESGLQAACTHVRPGGRLSLMSHLDGYTTADFLLGDLTRKDVTFTISYLNGGPENLTTAAHLLSERWSVVWDELIEVRSIDQLQQAFERRRISPLCKTLIHVDRRLA
jgi:threonine dehydrogenase-like Zn-dependent dehydrogenase